MVILFNPISIQISPDGGASLSSVPLLWAVGVLADSQPDFMGSWEVSGPKGSQWLAIVDDLKARGVEWIRFLIGPDPIDIQAAIAARYQGCNRMRDYQVLPTAGTSVEPALIESVLPGHRSYIKQVQEVAIPLGRRLERAVARHGSFADAGAAAALLYQSADRYIRANWPEAPGHLPSSESPRPAPVVRRKLVAAG